MLWVFGILAMGVLVIAGWSDLRDRRRGRQPSVSDDRAREGRRDARAMRANVNMPTNGVRWMDVERGRPARPRRDSTADRHSASGG